MSDVIAQSTAAKAASERIYAATGRRVLVVDTPGGGLAASLYSYGGGSYSWDMEDTQSTASHPHERAEASVEGWVEWSRRVGRPLPCDQVVADVVSAYASDLVPQGTWFPIASLPEGRHVLLYWPHGEKGVGGIECATVFRHDDGSFSYWTHGGPNSGDDWHPYWLLEEEGTEETPTHWMPLPGPPA